MSKPAKILKVLLIVVVAVTVVGFVVMHLWNWLMPTIFGLPAISHAQALGLLILSKLLLSGFRGGRHGGGEHRWGRHMRERWEKMSPEEREKLREGLRHGRSGWCGPRQFGRGGDRPWSHEEKQENEATHG